jgi:hypothetical protein
MLRHINGKWQFLESPREPKLPPPTVGERAIIGALLGVGFSLFLIAWATVIRVLVGPDMFARGQVSYTAAALAYLAGGALGGALIGVLQPLAQHRFGWLLLGVVGGLSMYGAGGIAIFGWPREPAEWFAIIVPGLIVGPLVARPGPGRGW